MYMHVSCGMYMYEICTIYMYLFSGIIYVAAGLRILIPPSPHYRGTRTSFSPSIDDCWYGRVILIFKMRVRTDTGGVMECKCALIETLFDYCPTEGRVW